MPSHQLGTSGFHGGWHGPGIPWATRPKFGVHYLPRVALLPASKDLRSGMPEIQDQLDLGACTAFAWEGALWHMAMVEQLLSAPTRPSELAFYYNERLTGGYAVYDDTGASLSDGARVAMKYGAIPSTVWPYVVADFAKPPPVAASIDVATICLSVPQDEVAIKTAIAEGFVVPYGISVYQSFMDAKGGMIPLPDPDNEQLLGGHATGLVGYTDSSRLYIGRNSWNILWGDSGYYYIPYDYVHNPDLASDFWTPRVVQ